MTNRYPHLVFYDGECGLCDQVVQTLLKIDKKHLFAFAPLQGTTAVAFISQLPPELKGIDSIILVENYQQPHYQLHVMSKAVFRILWLIGGVWTLIGWLYFLPAILFDWGYRLVARYRHQLFPHDQCALPRSDQKDRFLP